MAGGVVIKKAWRPKVPTLTTGGDRLGETDASYLLVQVARFDNDQDRDRVVLQFADYAGLEAEFEAGSVTTVLDSSLTTEIGAKTDWQTNPLSSTQRANILGVEYTE